MHLLFCHREISACNVFLPLTTVGIVRSTQRKSVLKTKIQALGYPSVLSRESCKKVRRIATPQLSSLAHVTRVPPKKCWRSQSCWLHLRESHLAADQGPGEVI